MKAKVPEFWLVAGFVKGRRVGEWMVAGEADTAEMAMAEVRDVFMQRYGASAEVMSVTSVNPPEDVKLILRNSSTFGKADLTNN